MPLLNPNNIFAGRYKLIKHIGTGAFAEVWKVEDTMAGNTVSALKIFAPDKGMDSNGIKIFREEYALSYSLQHQHLLKTYHFDIFNGSPYLKMPLCEGGNLMGKIVDKHSFSELEIAQIISQIGDALDYMHHERVFHQDIKPENILIYKTDYYVLADFGISRKIRKTLMHQGTNPEAKVNQGYSAFTTLYAPPEKYTSRPSAKGDVFSFGVTLYELIMGDLPFDNMGRAVKEGGDIPDFPLEYSRSLNNLVKACMQLNPNDRPTGHQLSHWANHYLKHRYWSIQVKESSPTNTSNEQETETPDSEKLNTYIISDIKPQTIPDLLEEQVKKSSSENVNDSGKIPPKKRLQRTWENNKTAALVLVAVFLVVIGLFFILTTTFQKYDISLQDICESPSEIEKLSSTQYGEELLQYYKKHRLDASKWQLLPISEGVTEKWLLPNFGFDNTNDSLSFACLIGEGTTKKLLIFASNDNKTILERECTDCWLELVEKGTIIPLEHKGEVKSHEAKHQELQLYYGDEKRMLIYNTDNKLKSWTW